MAYLLSDPGPDCTRAGARAGAWGSIALAGIHGSYLALGREEFRAPASLALLAALGLASLLQGAAAILALRDGHCP